MLRTYTGARIAASLSAYMTSVLQVFSQCYVRMSRFFVSRHFVDCCHFKYTFVAKMAQSVMQLSYGLGVAWFESRQDPDMFLFPKSSRPYLGPTRAPIQWAPGFFPGGKAPCTLCSPLISIWCGGKEWVEVNLCSPCVST